MPLYRPPSTDGYTGGIEWVEPLTRDIVGRVSTRVQPSVIGEIRGILNTPPPEWFPGISTTERIPRSELEELAEKLQVTYKTAQRWFGVVNTRRDLVPLRVCGRKGNSILSAEKRRRMCTVGITALPVSDPLHEADADLRENDFLRALLAGGVVSSKHAPFFPAGGRVTRPNGVYEVGGIYRETPIFGQKGSDKFFKITEYDPYPASSMADALEYIRDVVKEECEYFIESGHRLCAAWVRIFTEAQPEGSDYPFVVRVWHTFPKGKETYQLEQFDLSDPKEGAV